MQMRDNISDRLTNAAIHMLVMLTMITAFALIPVSHVWADTEWNGDQNFNDDTVIEDNITVTGDTVLSIASGKTLKVTV